MLDSRRTPILVGHRQQRDQTHRIAARRILDARACKGEVISIWPRSSLNGWINAETRLNIFLK
jgi:hypothetical protein